MVLHAPSIIFHLGAWAVTAVCTFFAFWINFLDKRDLLPRQAKRFVHPDTVARLDYVAAVTGLVGMAGVLVSVYFGFLDASQVANVSPLDFGALLTGINNALGNDVLSFKVQWTLVGIEAFAFAGILRLYFVTLKQGNSVYDQHYVFQIIYAEAIFVGYVCMTVVAGAGGIYVYGESLLSGIPFLEDLLPGGNLMAPILVATGLLAITFIISALLAEKAEQLANSRVKENI